MGKNGVFSVLTILFFQITIIESLATMLPLDSLNKNRNPFLFHRSTKDPSTRNGITKKNFNNTGNNHILNSSASPKIRGKKWQVGRVSRKHYEIINMLWRKTKIFFDIETMTEHYHPRKSNDSRKVADDPLVQEQQRVLRSSILRASTPSFIEFYYLDETDDAKDLTSPRYVKYYTKNKEERSNRNSGNIRLDFLNPVFAFHVNNPYYKKSVLPTRYMHPTNRMYRRQQRFTSPLVDFKTISSPATPYKFKTISSPATPYKFPHKKKLHTEVTTPTMTKVMTPTVTEITTPTTVSSNYSKEKPALNVTERLNNSTTFDYETCAITTEVSDSVNKSKETFINATLRETHPTSGTVYDKIKFFEMYDKNTYEPYYEYGKAVNTYDIDIVANSNVLNNNQKILLEHVDQSIGHNHENVHKTKHAKKHIIENNKDGLLDLENLTERRLRLMPVIFKATNKTTLGLKKEPLKYTTETEKKFTKFLQRDVSRLATWSQYPFAAVYVYEPLQVHCDAAGISRHWLITAGSCLSRHHKKPGGTGRSAFVTYCGDAWWNPERIAYVKYSVVHPRYHSQDEARRHLYNVGLIQVVTSMASACSGWSPISLMSYQLNSDDGGSTAIAVGWGLDRFDTRSQPTDLPRWPLSLYESRVYTNSCPGNFQYSKVKRLDDDGGIRNVYWLALPPYYKEENDPVHGTLLLVGGKLIALYLEEERRPWGEQCAQYTGIWRLIPWVLDVAHEPDEADSFTAEI